MWGVSEDEVLKAGVVKYGTNAWKQVAASMFSDRRSWRDCKERFELITEKVRATEKSPVQLLLGDTIPRGLLFDLSGLATVFRENVGLQVPE
ncbi:hypothetical protein F2Q68_00017421 [Brassica cretica]|uniref:Myb-like domain-containing protein n=1 Tax=Brassica cretica TaxID=69181 RepID=A0A8S9HSV4_BRACR|nr:hypothetical protein F2Q68_00017421 [Brassica cretica]